MERHTRDGVGGSVGCSSSSSRAVVRSSRLVRHSEVGVLLRSEVLRVRIVTVVGGRQVRGGRGQWRAGRGAVLRARVRRRSAFVSSPIEEAVLQRLRGLEALAWVVDEHVLDEVLEAQVIGDRVARLADAPPARAAALDAQYCSQLSRARRLHLHSARDQCRLTINNTGYMH